MADMEDALANLAGANEARQRLVNYYKDLIAQQDAKIDEITRAIREKLDAGESTGDRLNDMVLRVHGHNPELYKKYAALEAYLKGKKGESILLSAVTKVTSVDNKPMNRKIVTTRDVGYIHVEKLAGDELRIGLDSKGQQAITLNIQLVNRESPSQSWNPPKKLKAFQAFVGEINRNSPSLQELLAGDDWLGKSILVGTHAVENWLKQKDSGFGGASMAELVGYIEALKEPF